jgi:hypothetical protein
VLLVALLVELPLLAEPLLVLPLAGLLLVELQDHRDLLRLVVVECVLTCFALTYG